MVESKINKKKLLQTREHSRKIIIFLPDGSPRAWWWVRNQIVRPPSVSPPGSVVYFRGAPQSLSVSFSLALWMLSDLTEFPIIFPALWPLVSNLPPAPSQSAPSYGEHLVTFFKKKRWVVLMNKKLENAFHLVRIALACALEMLHFNQSCDLDTR